ncbi:MAG: protein O-mannosyl-transferase family [Candidatus Sumerlaeaceae bacterium]
MKLATNKNPMSPNNTTTPAEPTKAQSCVAPGRTRGIFLTVTAIAFLAYLRTLAPGLTFGDGPELVTASYVLGIPHPTGYPLYMMLLHLWLLIPLGEPMLMGNLFSAVAAAISAGLTAIFVYRLFADAFPRWPHKALLLGGVTGALTTAFLKMIWENATVAEVYALHMVFAVSFLLAAQSFAREQRPRTFLWATLWFGLGLAHHRLSFAFVAPLAIMAAWGMHKWRTSLAARTFLLAAGIIAATLLSYLYIPLRAAAHPPINWGYCVTWENFWKHVSGSVYIGQRFMRLAPGLPIMIWPWLRHESLILWQLVGDLAAQAFPVRLDEYLILENREYFRPTEAAFATGLAVFTLAIYGCVEWWRAQRFSAIAAATIAGLNFLVVLLYNIADISDYTLFPFWFLYLSAFVGIVHAVVRFLFPLLSKHLGPRAEHAYVLCAIPAAFFLMNLEVCDQSRNDEPELYSYFLLPQKVSEMPENSILITTADSDSFCSWYRQIVRKERTDVFVFGGNFISSSWYKSFFSAEQLRKYGIKFWPQVPRSPAEYAQALREGIIEPNINRFPIFTTLNDPYVIDHLSGYYEFKMRGKKFFLPRDILGIKACYLWEIRPKASGATKP